MEKERNLNALGKGEFDYDYQGDTLFFKVKEREYDFSLEIGNMVIDFDTEQFLVGIQVFNASEFFGLPKIVLRSLKHFQFKSKIDKGLLFLRLNFSAMIRNKLTNYQPMIQQKVGGNIPNSELVCTI
ncbi:MAG: hypothetical protein COV33_02535 [Candidatus Zambryskibacteria bacterium CG10_big_fil_rev_8_21_14_0_10_34_34]|uniref:DUF2283 domain-containing protein n=1 Tax=Candidatus Zambryskibacteria bacterium CG10_big_fil_rev_8_21_14_0_10_34_34 TaxID=1975114 RepID=A0A2H0R079_9BACT|nr:MAG: hypothetical protein COV33_02535 [Candidatus Zambryskibacteria bacterium CG10_big_fil_rev_8_21_14_0_10_34_34]